MIARMHATTPRVRARISRIQQPMDIEPPPLVLDFTHFPVESRTIPAGQGHVVTVRVREAVSLPPLGLQPPGCATFAVTRKLPAMEYGCEAVSTPAGAVNVFAAPEAGSPNVQVMPVERPAGSLTVATKLIVADFPVPGSTQSPFVAEIVMEGQGGVTVTWHAARGKESAPVRLQAGVPSELEGRPALGGNLATTATL